MKIHRIFTANELRNFTYILEVGGTAIVIDPWCLKQVNAKLEELKLTSVKAIINTHEHWDHVHANEDVMKQYKCEVWGHEKGEGMIPGLSRKLKHGDVVELEEGVEIRVLDTPGHCEAHLCFLLVEGGRPSAVFSGDVLFNAGCGRSPNPPLMYETFENIISKLDDRTVVHPGHDYMINNLGFTLSREPGNEAARLQMEKTKRDGYQPSTIGQERTFNTFFRLDSKELIENLKSPTSSSKDVFITLRKLRNSW
eukprot:TRINITY_DN35317_c0_g1_i1.p1 TRINITY_DN35317_c0_g1~~TRINITY_DN35317_c0_g1_i1.p1  ORF type:complete len:253 (+),score=74.60 TRINITY_DN35317_c0_g1_i1:58-816(+)